jgi:hypothetical protein
MTDSAVPDMMASVIFLEMVTTAAMTVVVMTAATMHVKRQPP